MSSPVCKVLLFSWNFWYSPSSIFAILITMFWCVPLWVNPVWDSLYFLDLDVCFFSQVREVFSYSLFNYVLSPPPSLCGTHVMWILVHLMLSQRELSSLFLLLFLDSFYSFIIIPFSVQHQWFPLLYLPAHVLFLWAI